MNKREEKEIAATLQVLTDAFVDVLEAWNEAVTKPKEAKGGN